MLSKNQEVKAQTVSEISEKLKKAKSVVFVDYRGINSKDDTKMRADLRKAGCEYHVYKNNIMARALTENGIKALDGKLEGTLAVAFSFENEVDAAKVMKPIVDNKKIAFKFGFAGDSFLDENSIKALASLPSREVLIAQLLGMLNTPTTTLASVLIAPIRGLAVALGAIAKK